MHLDKEHCNSSYLPKNWQYIYWYNFINAKNLFKMPIICILKVNIATQFKITYFTTFPSA